MWIGLALFVLFAALPAGAAGVSLKVTDQNGQALPDAVIILSAPGGETGPKPTAREHFIDQSNETFVPLVELVQAGEQVIFRNSDKTRHHVYSFSPLGAFEFVLKPGESSPPVRLDKPGVIAVGCNIHDFMINYLIVSDTRWAGKTDAKGALTLADLPAGAYSAKLWHPRLRPGSVPPPQTITVGAEGAAVTLPMTVLPARREDPDREKY